MEIISLESPNGEEFRLSQYQGIALTNKMPALECFSTNELLLQSICVVYLESGKASFSIGNQEVRLEAGELVVINFAQRISDILYSSNLQFRAFVLSPEFMNTIVERIHLDWDLRSEMMQLSHMCLRLEEEEGKCIALYYDLLDSKRKQTRHQQQGIDALCAAFGYEFLDILEKHDMLKPQVETDNGHGAMKQHFDQFMTLLMNKKPTERKVAWYAERLCISPKYLNIICQQTVEKTPSELIENEISQRAVELLNHSSLSIKEISQQLGFTNQSHFGTFMRRMTGKSPLQIKNK